MGPTPQAVLACRRHGLALTESELMKKPKSFRIDPAHTSQPHAETLAALTTVVSEHETPPAGQILANTGIESRAALAKSRSLGARLGGLIVSPVLLGSALTVGIYAILPHVPGDKALLERYLTSHPIEYGTMAIFVIGIVTLAQKWLATRAERTALRRAWIAARTLPSETPHDAKSPKRSKLSLSLARTESLLSGFSPRLLRTTLAERVRNSCEHVRGKKSHDQIDDHLKYLAELASLRLSDSYALIRTITWAIPILGFLGTVIGITMAIANVTPEQLDTSLNEVTGGLAVAFDTTALSLSLSMVLVFCTFVVERTEQRILSEVEDFGVRELAPLFPHQSTPENPIAAAEEQAARTLIDRTESLIVRQTEVWNESLESMRSRWTNTLAEQQQSLAASLQTGMSHTLSDHASQLQETRREFLTAFETAASSLQANIEKSQTRQREAEVATTVQLHDFWNRMQNEMTEVRRDQQQRLDGLVEAVSQRVGSWQSQLSASTQAGVEQLDELRKQRETMLKVYGQEKQLSKLQIRLNENLEAVRSAQSFEETLHSLNAAVHLLTARVRANAAA